MLTVGTAINSENLSEFLSALTIYIPQSSADDGFDASLYTKAELDIDVAKYYISTSKTYKNPVTSNSTAQKYAATQTFTKETLPVGSVIWIAEDRQYRPEGWRVEGDIIYTNNSSSEYPSGLGRPDNVSESYIVVTEDWWGEFDVRAFNICRIDSTDISGYTPEQIAEIFIIYIPAEDLAEN